MKGVVFVAFGDMVSEYYGLAFWHQLLDEAGDDGVYTATINYPDIRLGRLVETFCLALSADVSEALRSFGEYLFDALHRSAPVFADSSSTFVEFIDRIGSVIHTEVYKLDGQARPPHISVLNATSNSADMIYRSERKLCFLAEGLLKGAAKHYSIKIDITQSQCMHEGASECVFKVLLHE